MYSIRPATSTRQKILPMPRLLVSDLTNYASMNIIRVTDMLHFLHQIVMQRSQKLLAQTSLAPKAGPSAWVAMSCKSIHSTESMMRLTKRLPLPRLTHMKRHRPLVKQAPIFQCAHEWTVTEVESTNLITITSHVRKNCPVQVPIFMPKPLAPEWCHRLLSRPSSPPFPKLVIDSDLPTYPRCSQHPIRTLQWPIS